jgi:hypothetical protein
MQPKAVFNVNVNFVVFVERGGSEMSRPCGYQATVGRRIVTRYLNCVVNILTDALSESIEFTKHSRNNNFCEYFV